MDKTKIGAIVVAIAVMMLLTSLVMPWWTYSEESEDEDATQRQNLEILRPLSHPHREFMENQTTTNSITSVMATVGTGASVLSLLFIGMAVGSDSKKHAKIGSVLLVIGLIFAIVAPLFFMISWPDAILGDVYDGDEDNIPEDRDDTPAESFFGSDDAESGELIFREEVEASWRGGIGWFMSLISGVLLIIALAFVVLGSKSPVKQEPVRGQRPGQQTYRQGTTTRREEGSAQKSQDQTEEQRTYEKSSNQAGAAGVSQQQRGQTKEETQPQQESHPCPDCGQPIRYIQEYDRWYCDTCQEYK